MRPKKPFLAAVLNLLIPGLGCAYLEKWFYAIVFFIWVPLSYLTSFVVVVFVANLIPEGTLKTILSITVALFLFVRIIYEQVSMPYQMAIEINQRLESENV